MAYEKTKALAEEKGITAEDLMAIITSYAEEMEADEPQAVSSINYARNIALDLFEILSA